MICQAKRYTTRNGCRKTMKMNSRGNTQVVLAHWRPSRDSAVALLTELGMILSYVAIGRSGDNITVMMLFVAFVVPILTIGVPVCWVGLVKRERLESLGLTLHHWLPAILLGGALSAFEVGQVLTGRGSIAPANLWMPQAVAGAVSLWEPLFVFGWLQLRFERDFGVLPAILMASVCFALYHVGFGSVNMMVGQFFSAVAYATVFRLVTSLFVLWPLLWAASSARICIGDGFCLFDWGSATFMAILFLVEIAFVAFAAYRQRLTASRLL
jgi:membrane protease YdiL (CAAX protease family)